MADSADVSIAHNASRDSGAPKDSCLTERHIAAGAKFADFAGWRMPIEYAGTGVLAEHAAVREAVGIFDVSHLGTVRITGTGAVAFANRCFTNDLDRIGAGGAQYTLCCDPDTGEVVDDLIVYRIADDQVLCVPNAANTPAVAERLGAAAPAGVAVDDESGTHGIIAVQGPKSTSVLDKLGLPSSLEYMGFASATWDSTVPVTVARSGYTGERGYEIVVPAADASKLWNGLLDAGKADGIRPCGLGARDTLRTEMGYPLHGQDLGHGISALQAGLGWAIGWRKPEFWGAAVLRAEREADPDGRIVGLSFEGRGVPRPAMAVFADAAEDSANAEPIGAVTSGTFSPTLRNGIALALLRNPGPWLAAGGRVQVDVRGRRIPATVVKPPFVESHVR